MRTPTSLFVLSLFILFSCGCRGLQSEMQKSRIAAASPTAQIGGKEFRLEAELSRVFEENRFDLIGRIKVIPEGTSFPTTLSVDHFTLKPSWSGWPGYYVNNFTRRDGVWRMAGRYGSNPNFSGTSVTNKDYLIEFAWRDLGSGLGKKKEHFDAFDVSVTMSDATGARYILSKTNVPSM